MFNDPMFIVALLIATALLLHVILFGRVSKQAEARNKFLAAELEKLQDRWQNLNETNTFHHDRANEWMERFKSLEELAAETGKKRQKQISDLEKDRDDYQRSADYWKTHNSLHVQEIERQKEQTRTTWHAHQVVKKGKQVICLTAIVTAEDGPGAVAAFEAQMKEVKAKMRIRSKAPVFAKPVFPNY
jgi:hypothetical protein